MSIGQKLNYFGNIVEVVLFDYTHVVIRFESGLKFCVNKNSFEKL